MKLHKLFLTILLLFISFQICFGQEILKAELIDRFLITNDCDLQSKTKNFLQNIYSTRSKALVIVYGTEKDEIGKYIYEKWIQSWFERRNVPAQRFSFAFGENKNESVVEFWKIPDDTMKPDFIEIPRNYEISKLDKSYLIASSEAMLFDEMFDLKLYANFLKKNSNLLGKIVFYSKNQKSIPEASAKHLKELVGKYKVLRSQIKIVYSKQKMDYSYQNYWLIPKK